MASLDTQSLNLDGTLMSEYELESVDLSMIEKNQENHNANALQKIGNLFDKVDALDFEDDFLEEKKVPGIDLNNLPEDDIDKECDSQNMSERDTYRDKEELLR